LSIKVEFGFAKQGEGGIPQFNDISNDVISIGISRGKDPQQDTFNAASCSIQLNNETRNYDPDYGPSPYQGQIVPTGQVRIYKDDQIVFTGLITDWNFRYTPTGESLAEIVASDAFWNLNNQRLTDFAPVEQLSSARILSVLTRPEVGGTVVWPTSSRLISPGVATMGDYEVSDGTNVLSYLQEVEKAEPGRLFIDKQGRIVFRSRNNDLLNPDFEYIRVNLSSNPSFENNTNNWVATSGTVASITPPTIRTNLVPFATISSNSSQFNSTAGTGGSETTSWVTNLAYPSGVALRRTINTNGSTQSWIGMGTTVARNAAVTAGKTYTGSVFVNSQFSFSGRATLVWRNSSDAVISTEGPANNSVSSNQLTRLSFTGVAPTGAVGVGVRLFYTTTSATTGQTIDYTSQMVEESSELGSYFDGNSLEESNPRTLFDWSGLANSSTSVATQPFVGTKVGSLSSGGVVQQLFESSSGDDYTASVYAKSSAGTVPVTISGLTSSDGVTYTATNPVTSEINNADWTRINTTFSGVSPFSGVRIGNSTAAIFLDALLIEQTPVVDAYFDGDNAPVYNTTDPEAPDYQPARAFESYDPEWVLG
jgi:hypothetical protein